MYQPGCNNRHVPLLNGWSFLFLTILKVGVTPQIVRSIQRIFKEYSVSPRKIVLAALETRKRLSLSAQLTAAPPSPFQAVQPPL